MVRLILLDVGDFERRNPDLKSLVERGLEKLQGLDHKGGPAYTNAAWVTAERDSSGLITYYLQYGNSYEEEKFYPIGKPIRYTL